MSDPNQSEPLSELLAGYVLGDLSPAEIEIVERYLAAHPDRQAEISSLMLPLDLLPLGLPADNPPASVRSQIMQIAEAEAAAASSPIQPTKTVDRSNRSLQLALSGLGLLLLAGLGWQNYRLTQELATVKQDLSTQIAQEQKSQTYRSIVSLLEQPNNRFMSLKNMSGKPMGMGSLVMAPQQSSAVLTLQQLPKLPQGKVYRMWAMIGDEEMACADFLPDDRGKVLMKIPLDRWEKATKVVVTIEQKDAKTAEGEIAIEGESGV